MSSPKLVVTKIEFNPQSIAEALRIEPDQVISAFRDGRGAWPFSEIWGAKLYEFIKHGNTNVPFSDGAIALEQLRDVNVSVKALTRGGIKFQQSKFVGFGRRTDKEGLIASLEACDRVVIVDLTEFPTVSFLPVDGTRLVSAAHKGALTTTGWSKAALMKWLQATYAVSEVTLAL
ncbi:MAG: hypothetical protein INR68_08910 [Methylobacterium mesophilicum]|nr:hypothetical protein [Methylobacterium mesophilicum]